MRIVLRRQTTFSLLHLPSNYSGHLLDGVLPYMQPGLSSRGLHHQQLPIAPCANYNTLIVNSEYKEVI